MIVTAIIKKKRLDNKELEKYEYNTHEMLGVRPKELMDISTDEIISQYSTSENGMDKIELIAVSLLLFSEETANDQLLLKSRLKQNGLFLLKYLQQNSNSYSIQREMLMKMIS